MTTGTTISNVTWHRTPFWIGLVERCAATRRSNTFYDTMFGHSMNKILQQPPHVNQLKRNQRISKRKYSKSTENRRMQYCNLHYSFFYFTLFFYSKETPIENTILCPPPVVPSKKSFESPPPSTRDLTNPPPLIRQKKLKKDDDSDDSSEEPSKSDGYSMETDVKCYNLRSLSSDERKVTIPSSPHRTLRKRVVDESKAATARTASPTKRTKKTADVPSLDSMYRMEPKTNATATRSTHPCSSTDLSMPYSELRYLESIGSIRTIRRAKHPGINKVPTAKTEVATPFVSPESQNGWDRKTKLKIGYRIGLPNQNDIQFALIIYEPLTMVSRRNLMEEFQQAALEEEKLRSAREANATSKLLFSSPLDPLMSDDSLKVNMKTSAFRVKPKTDKIATLRRLRF